MSHIVELREAIQDSEETVRMSRDMAVKIADEITELNARLQPIETAPKDREILVYNPFEGWYRTRYEVDGEKDRSCWPLYRNLHHSSLPDQRVHGEASVWYPWPTHWREKWEPKP